MSARGKDGVASSGGGSGGSIYFAVYNETGSNSNSSSNLRSSLLSTMGDDIEFRFRKFEGRGSFNVDGGRCEVCKGEGTVTIEMQFMADVILTCENCQGKRFKKEILEVKFQNTNIDDLLNMTVDDAIAFFEAQGQQKIINKLKSLQEVGLGYVTLGQSSATLSGGEAQRIKLASFLGQGITKEKVLFIFDEELLKIREH